MRINLLKRTALSIDIEIILILDQSALFQIGFYVDACVCFAPIIIAIVSAPIKYAAMRMKGFATLPAANN